MTQRQSLRLVMMGTGPFAVPTFRRLAAGPDVITGVVTRPPRGKDPPPSPMREIAIAAGWTPFEPGDINSAQAHAWLQEQRADVFVVCDYGQILSADTLRLARLGGINLHGSLLPKYRGAAPVAWAIWKGEIESGVTVIHMTPQLDAGPMLVQSRLTIDPQETCGALEARLSQVGANAVAHALDQLARWDGASPLGTPQVRAQATRAPRLCKADGEIDWSQPAEQIRNQVRALQPWPGTFTHLVRPGAPPLRLLIGRVEVAPDASPIATAAKELSAAPEGDDVSTLGDVSAPGDVRAAADRLLVATGKGTISLTEVQPAGKRSMSVAEFLRGRPIGLGARFGGADA